MNGVTNTTIMHAALVEAGSTEPTVALGGHPGWYGTHTMSKSVEKTYVAAKHKLTYVPARSLQSLLAQLVSPADAGLVDLLDVDVQGAEHITFDDATMALVNGQVLRIHIGTHGKGTKNLKTGELNTSDVGYQGVRGALGSQEVALVNKFLAHRWRPRWLIGQTAGDCDHRDLFRVTPHGLVCMADGVLSFVNQRFEQEG